MRGSVQRRGFIYLSIYIDRERERIGLESFKAPEKASTGTTLEKGRKPGRYREGVSHLLGPVGRCAVHWTYGRRYLRSDGLVISRNVSGRMWLQLTDFDGQDCFTPDGFSSTE